MKNVNNDISKILKTQKLPQKYLKTKNLKKSESFKEASNEKVQKKLQLESKNIKNDIFKNYKNSKLTPKNIQKQKFKISMTCMEASNEKVQ